tara:strand:+ start:1331 stop:1579 length:249 start_codon:yes stop_codon:yes gene_type:complete
MCVEKINNLAGQIIEEKNNLNDNKKKLESLSEKNNLYKIDKDDKAYWRDCEKILEEKHLELNKMIKAHLEENNIKNDIIKII